MENKKIQKAKDFIEQKFLEVNGYTDHSVNVFNILKNDFLVDDEEILIAGLLHDVLEDTNTDKKEIEEIFSKNIADIVDELSHPKNYTKEEKIKYMDSLVLVSDNAKIVKIADFIDSLRWMISIYKKNKQEEYPKFKNNDKYIVSINNFLESCVESKGKNLLMEIVEELKDLT